MYSVMNAMEKNIKLVEKVVIKPEKLTERRRMFLSNIDLSLVVDQDSVSFFDPPLSNNDETISFSEYFSRLCVALATVLVPYDFLAGRLVPCLESDDQNRLEIDCNRAGVVVAAATTETKLSEFGELLVPKPELRQLVGFLNEEGDENMDLKDKPLLSLQLTRFGCGSLALGTRYNHCTLDGFSVKVFELNLAALTRGDNLVITPKPDRSIFKARNPLKITHAHYEYSKATDTTQNLVFTARGKSNSVSMPCQQPSTVARTHMIHLSPQQITASKKSALIDGKLSNCTTFQVIAAKIWKARSIARKMEGETVSTMLFPMDVRKKVVPEAPAGLSGNALVPAYARATMKELMEEEVSDLVRRVQEGMERLDDEYIRSGIDWLEMHGGVPSHQDNSFSLVAWSKLGLEGDVFAWGPVKCTTTIELKDSLVMLLPAPTSDGGLNICLQLPDDQIDEFSRLLTQA